MAILNILPMSPPQSLTINDVDDPKKISTNLQITLNEVQPAVVNVSVGVQGPPGSGLPGERGIQGIQGERGERGIQGIQGIPGPTGSGVASLTFSNGIDSFDIDDSVSTVSILGGNGTTVSINDINNTITIHNDLVGHTHLSADILNFNESVDDRVDQLLQAGDNIDLNYQDADFNSLTISVTGLDIGIDVQAQNQNLQYFADLVFSPGQLIYVNDDSELELITLSNTTKAFLNDVSAAEQRQTLGLGTASTFDDTDFAKLNGNNLFDGDQSFSDGRLNRFSATFSTNTNSSYEIIQSDNGKILTFDNSAGPVLLTMDDTINVGFNCLIVQLGDGQVRFNETIQNRYGHSKLVGQYSIATLVKISDNPSIVILSGDTTSANSGP